MKLRQSWIAPGIAALALASARADAAPAIRSNDKNRVPACASPERLTSYLRDRNPRLDPKFADIAFWYRHWGEAWRVRWDYAFFQMIVETNALKFRRGDGRMGDVKPSQNNFAGIGATGGGVPGNRFPDVKTGVHAQIQHLVAYSGERLKDPVAPRTALKQDDIIELSHRLKRPVTFADLARRWAADRHYARTIDAVADDFKSRYCGPRMEKAETFHVPKPQPASRHAIMPPDVSAKDVDSGRMPTQPSASGRGERLPWQKQGKAAPTAKSDVREVAVANTLWKHGDASARPAPPERASANSGSAASCRVLTASYGGDKTLLIRARHNGETVYTALTVLEGFETSMFDSYARASAPGAEIVAEYQNPDDAIAHARSNCYQQQASR